MYKEITDYVKTVITDLKEVDAGFDVEMLPANQMNNYYSIKFDSIEVINGEGYPLDKVNIIIETWFLLANKKDNYKDAIEKLNTLKSSLVNLSSTDGIVNPENIKVNGLNNIIKGNWLQSNITFEIMAFET